MSDATIGLRVQELRLNAGLTQKELAERAGLTVTGLSYIERGTREPGWSTVVALAKALGVEASAFQTPPSAKTKPQGRGRPKKNVDGTATPTLESGRLVKPVWVTTGVGRQRGAGTGRPKKATAAGGNRKRKKA